MCGLLFPFLLLAVLPGYRRFSTSPDFSDLSFEDTDREEKEESSEPPHHTQRELGNTRPACGTPGLDIYF